MCNEATQETRTQKLFSTQLFAFLLNESHKNGNSHAGGKNQRCPYLMYSMMRDIPYTYLHEIRRKFNPRDANEKKKYTQHWLK